MLCTRRVRVYGLEVGAGVEYAYSDQLRGRVRWKSAGGRESEENKQSSSLRSTLNFPIPRVRAGEFSDAPKLEDLFKEKYMSIYG